MKIVQTEIETKIIIKISALLYCFILLIVSDFIIGNFTLTPPYAYCAFIMIIKMPYFKPKYVINETPLELAAILLTNTSTIRSF